MLIEVTGRVFTTEKITFNHAEGVAKFTAKEDDDDYVISLNTIQAIHDLKEVNKDNFVAMESL